MSFSFDSRWIAISTLRGTTHLFAINPYGGTLITLSLPHEKVKIWSGENG
jgi:hypothetical protein